MKDTSTPRKITLKELVSYYEDFLVECQKKSPETYGTYQRALRTFVHWFPMDKKFTFRARDIERYKRYLAEHRDLKNISIATYVTALRRFCQYLVDIGVLKSNPGLLVIGGRRPERHTREFLTYEEVDQLLSSIDTTLVAGARDMAIITLMLDCALSEHECLLADVGDVVKRPDGGWIMNVQGKGRSVKDEKVEVSRNSFEIIKVYLDRRFGGRDWELAAPLFSSVSNRSRDGRMTARGMRNVINRWLKESGVKGERDRKLTPFSLRHTAGLMLVDRGATVEEVMAHMRIEWRPTAQLYFAMRAAKAASIARSTTNQ